MDIKHFNILLSIWGIDVRLFQSSIANVKLDIVLKGNANLKLEMLLKGKQCSKTLINLAYDALLQQLNAKIDDDINYEMIK